MLKFRKKRGDDLLREPGLYKLSHTTSRTDVSNSRGFSLRTFPPRWAAPRYINTKMLIKKVWAGFKLPMSTFCTPPPPPAHSASVSRRPRWQGKVKSSATESKPRSARREDGRGLCERRRRTHANTGSGETTALWDGQASRWARGTLGGHTSLVIRPYGRQPSWANRRGRPATALCPVCSQRLSPLTGPGEGITRRRLEWCAVRGRTRGPSRPLFSKSLRLGIQTMPLH